MNEIIYKPLFNICVFILDLKIFLLFELFLFDNHQWNENNGQELVVVSSKAQNLGWNSRRDREMLCEDPKK